jgi:DNA modification methylase
LAEFSNLEGKDIDCGCRGVFRDKVFEKEVFIGLMDVFNQIYRILKPSGTFWLNIGDSYAGSGRGKGDVNRKGLQQKGRFIGDKFDKPYKLNGYKNKDLIGVPWILAFALRESGWYLRQEIIWHKPNPMPESVRDRCTKSHESIFLLTKKPKYYFDHLAIMEPAKYDGRKDTKAKGSPKYAQITGSQVQGFAKEIHERWPNKIKVRVFGSKRQTGTGRNDVGNVWVDKPAKNKRDVWVIPTHPFKEAHFATFPPALITDCIKAGCPVGGVVLDPFFGSGTTGLVAQQLGRNYIGIELNPEYVKIAQKRLLH